MTDRKPEQVRSCIICEHTFDDADASEYDPLEHFDDLCICRECLRQARDGSARAAAKPTAADPAGE